jgi:hypothetical protein
MQQGNSKVRYFVLMARLIAHQAKMILFDCRCWLLGIALFLVLRWPAIAVLHGRI